MFIYVHFTHFVLSTFTLGNMQGNNHLFITQSSNNHQSPWIESCHQKQLFHFVLFRFRVSNSIPSLFCLCGLVFVSLRILSWSFGCYWNYILEENGNVFVCVRSLYVFFPSHEFVGFYLTFMFTFEFQF